MYDNLIISHNHYFHLYFTNPLMIKESFYISTYYIKGENYSYISIMLPKLERFESNMDLGRFLLILKLHLGDFLSPKRQKTLTRIRNVGLFGTWFEACGINECFADFIDRLEVQF